MEDTLIQEGTFSLPRRKAPLKSNMEYEVILVDATESPIERPREALNKSTMKKEENGRDRIIEAVEEYRRK